MWWPKRVLCSKRPLTLFKPILKRLQRWLKTRGKCQIVCGESTAKWGNVWRCSCPTSSSTPQESASSKTKIGLWRRLSPETRLILRKWCLGPLTANETGLVSGPSIWTNLWGQTDQIAKMLLKCKGKFSMENPFWKLIRKRNCIWDMTLTESLLCLMCPFQLELIWSSTENDLRICNSNIRGRELNLTHSRPKIVNNWPKS